MDLMGVLNNHDPWNSLGVTNFNPPSPITRLLYIIKLSVRFNCYSRIYRHPFFTLESSDLERRLNSYVHERITNKRGDFVQKVSSDLVKTYDLIVFEDLNIKGMVKNHCLAKHITDAAWNKLIAATSYKAEWAGKRVEMVNPSNTSQICSGCGQIVLKDLSERVHKCPFCGLTLDRDHNAAINILRLGLQSVANA